MSKAGGLFNRGKGATNSLLPSSNILQKTDIGCAPQQKCDCQPAAEQQHSTPGNDDQGVKSCD
ncbi:hypothetical protein [Sphingobium fuliginis]|nr:hypothetical protein [Sphingobium fuliginis]